MKPCWSEDILQAYLDGELAQEISHEVAAHLAECATCTTHVGSAQQMMMAIDGALANDAPAVIPTARLQARIASALAENTAPKFTLAALWNWKLAAVTGGILLLLSALIFRPANEPQREARVSVPVPVSTPKAQSTPSAPPPERVAARQPEKPRKHNARRVFTNTAVAAEVATPFYSLVEDGELAPLESGRVVRVEVTAATLIPFGFSVTAEAMTQPVQADLLYGQDGLARAIRFLPTTKTQ